MSYTDAVAVTIIGIDFAAQAKGTGLALGRHARRGLTLREVRMARDPDDLDQTLARWAGDGEVLIAADAPLGWPQPLARRLATHRAGEQLGGMPNDLFRRMTDRDVHARLGKLPLEVGADRIARTAHAALEVLGRLRIATGRAHPALLRLPDDPIDGVIETYPAATLIAHGLSPRGYKGTSPEAATRRLELSAWLLGQCRGPLTPAQLSDRDDLLDAAVCVVAGADFLRGRARPPTASQRAQAEHEGWIWVGEPQ